MANITHAATIDGINDFQDLDGNTISWNGGDFLADVGMFEPNAADTTTVNVTLSGSNWGINSLRFGSQVDFVNISEANANSGREIELLRLGRNSDVDLDTTRVEFIRTASGGQLHDVSLGSAGARLVELRADENILTTGSGFVDFIKTRGDDTVTINSGGARTVDVGGGTDDVTIRNGASVDLLRAHDGDNTIRIQANSRVDTLEANDAQNDITVSGDGRITTLDLHRSTNTVDLQGNGRVAFLQTSESTNTIDTDMRWFGSFDSWNATNTINIGTGGAGNLQFGSDSFRLQTITTIGFVQTINVTGNQRTILDLGEEGANSVRLGDRGDTVTTGDGFVDYLRTGEGNDTVSIGDGGGNLVRLDEGNDRITTSTGFVDTIRAGNGNDIVNLGSGGAYSVRGEDGNDRVNLSEASFGSILDGGSGIDILDFRAFSTGVTFSLGTSDVQSPTASGPGYIAFSFENLNGTFHNDRLTGSDGANRIDALGGNDTVSGLDGNDVVFGRNGNDVLNGNRGADTLRGNDGNDTLRGQEGNDRLEGGKGRDRLEGGNQNDFLAGGNANDTLLGGNGNDRLFGGNQNDRLVGGNGADTIVGGNGNDILVGGAGPDEFQFAANAGTDRVEDFQDGTDLLHIFGHAGGFGTLGFSDVGSDLHVTHDGGTIILEGLAGTTLTMADFDFN